MSSRITLCDESLFDVLKLFGPISDMSLPENFEKSNLAIFSVVART